MKSTKKSAPGGAIHFNEREGGRIDWSVGHDSLIRIRRFQEFQHAVLSDRSPTTGTCAAHLVAFDAVRPEHLHFIEPSTHPYWYQEHLAIEWLAPKPTRVERRQLSPFTAAVWPTEPINRFHEGLKQWLGNCATYSRCEHPLMEISHDQLCWLQAFCPAALFAHVADAFVWSALPRSALARQQARRSLAIPESSSLVTSVLIPETN